jgi:hypothetical protein
MDRNGTRNVTRRGFLGAAGAVSAGVLVSGARPASASTAEGFSAGGRAAAGDLAARIEASARRLTGPGVPELTDDFVLADVTLDPGRRFTNYSGDLSGRYIEALSVLPAPSCGPADLRPLVSRLRREQQPDGRFGRADLRFTAAEIGTDHMPLLWGNGRLLVGLMAFHHATGDAETLAAARRLGDFLMGVRAAAGSREVIERVERGGAAGFICFTQLNEGLVLLWQATRDDRCLAAAREIARLLPARGTLHSHGYLTTRRGALMLYEATREPALLAELESAFEDLASSDDLLVDGGVHEFFGWDDPANATALEAARSGSGEDGRNEGCSLADLVRLALRLYRVTGKLSYLEAAERCWLNAFAHNQFESGDFGHRTYFPHGFAPVPNLARAWWCCTMHGYRCFPEVLEAAVATEKGVVRVDLFEDLRLEGNVALSTEATGFGVKVRFDRRFDGTLALRVPSWAEAARLFRGGTPAEAAVEEGYLRPTGPFAALETVEAVLTPRVRVRTRDGREVSPGELPSEPIRGAVLVGPYLMAVAEEHSPDFFGEPWSGSQGDRPDGNVIRLETSAASGLVSGRWPRLSATYDHAGFRGRHPVTLHALGTRPARDQQIHAVWLNLARAEAPQPAARRASS